MKNVFHSRMMWSAPVVMVGLTVCAMQADVPPLELRVGDVLTHVIEIPVPEAGSKRIESITSSCECAEVVSFSMPHWKNRPGYVELELRPEEPGLYRYEITVVHDAKKDRKQMLFVDVNVAPADTRSELYRSARDVLGKDGLTFVDVRSAFDYREAHIPDALNLSAFAIRARSFLRSRSLVLVDGGWGDSALERTCRQLRESGFGSVSILRGGMAAWQQSGGPLAGTRGGAADLAKVAPDAFMAAYPWQDWVFVLPDDADAGELDTLAVHIHRLGDGQDVSALTAIAETKAAGILILWNDSETAADLRDDLVQRLDQPVFMFDGGLAEWAAHRAISLRSQRSAARVSSQSVRDGQNVAYLMRKPCDRCPGK